MSQPDSPLRDGIAAVKAGRKEAARTLLKTAVQQEPENEEAWLWLAAAAASPRDTLVCLKRVLAINPQNGKATAGVRWATAQLHQERDNTPPSDALAPQPNNMLAASGAAASASTLAAPVDLVPVLNLGQKIVPPSTKGKSFFPNLIVGFLCLTLVLGIVIVAGLLYVWLR